MDFKDLKDIKDKVNEIERVKVEINDKIDSIDNVIINGVYVNIFDNIDNNVEINKDSLYSIYDWCDEPNSKKLILNNIKLIDSLGLTKYINHEDYEKSFSKITDEINSFIINRFDIEKNIELYDYLNYDLNDIIDKIVIDEFDDVEFMSYLESIESFYYSVLSSLNYMILQYGEFF